MTELNKTIKEVAKQLYIKALKNLPEDVKKAILSANTLESSPTSKNVLAKI